MSITNTNAVAKVAAVVAGLGLVAMSFASFAVPAKAATAAEIAAQIAALNAQLASLQGGAAASVTFTRDLTIGSTGADVTALQNWLISKGFSIPAGATGYFGAQTKAALAAYQASVMISPAAGYFGPITRAKVNATGGGSTGGGSTGGGSTGGGLSGGAGSIDSFDEMSNFSSEQVGEDEEDVEVAGLEIEVDDGSDIELTAVRLDFATQPSNDDLDEFITEVSVWCDGEEVARVDAEEFNDDNDWTKTVSLDDGCIIDAGDTGELTVAVTGVSNIDSDDAGDDWGLDFVSVRFEDADGASITETTSTDAFTFDVDTFAAATGVELKVALSDDSPDARIVSVDDTQDTDNQELLRFTLEAEDSDIMVQDLPLTFATSTGGTATTLAAIASSVTLEIDGEEYSENTSSAVASTTGAIVTFDDIDIEIGEGEEIEVIVTADINDTEAGSFVNGDSLTASVTALNRNDMDAEDQTGEDLNDSDKTGTALGDAQSFRSSGIMVTFVSADEVVTGNDGADNDSGTFTIKVNVESFDSTIYVASSSRATDDTTVNGSSVLEHLYVVQFGNTATTTGVGDAIAYTTDDGASLTSSVGNIELADGESTELTFSITRSTGGGTDNNGLYRALIAAIAWDTVDEYGSYNIYNFDLDDFKTDYANFD